MSRVFGAAGVVFGLALLFGGVVQAAPVSMTSPGAFTLTANASCSQIDLSWSGSVGAERYTVYRDGSAVYTVEAWYFFDRPQYGYYTDQTVGAEETYRYRVVATNSGPTATWSNEITVTTPACPRPTSVTVTPPSVELGQGEEVTFTATPEGISAPPQPSSFSIDFDDLAAGQAVTTEYQATTGVTFGLGLGEPETSADNRGCGTTNGSEASSPPNFLKAATQPLTLTLSTPATTLSFDLVSVGINPVTVSFLDAAGNVVATHVEGPHVDPTNTGSQAGACNHGAVIYRGTSPISQVRLQPQVVSFDDGYGIDSLTFTRSLAAGSAPYLFWYVTDPTLGEILPQPDNQARFVVSQTATPGFYPNAVNVVMGYNFGFYTDAVDVTIKRAEVPSEPLEVTVTAEPASVPAGSTITVRWTATRGQSNAQDWIAMYSVPETGAVNNEVFGQWQWVDDNRAGGQTSGTRTFFAPATAGTYMFRYLLGRPPAETWYDDIAQSNPVTVSAAPPPPPPPPRPSGGITGDIYARGNVGNLSVSADSVVSASGTVDVTGTSYTIGNYSRTTEQSTEATIAKLKKEKAVKLASDDYTLSGAFFNLNPKNGNPTSDTRDNAAKPEGGVWYVPGNLIITDTTIYGRGTIIVGKGVTLMSSGSDARLAYATTGTPLLGVIAETGSINLTGFDEVNGVFYAPKGTITLGSGLTASGLFVGQSVVLESSDVAITYDGRITKSPPLGFSEAFVPALSEVTP